LFCLKQRVEQVVALFPPHGDASSPAIDIVPASFSFFIDAVYSAQWILLRVSPPLGRTWLVHERCQKSCTVILSLDSRRRILLCSRVLSTTRRAESPITYEYLRILLQILIHYRKSSLNEIYFIKRERRSDCPSLQDPLTLSAAFVPHPNHAAPTAVACVPSSAAAYATATQAQRVTGGPTVRRRPPPGARAVATRRQCRDVATLGRARPRWVTEALRPLAHRRAWRVRGRPPVRLPA